MEKTVVFEELDKALIERIEAYRETKELSFSEAVKALCEEALSGNGGIEWGSFEECK